MMGAAGMGAMVRNGFSMNGMIARPDELGGPGAAVVAARAQ